MKHRILGSVCALAIAALAVGSNQANAQESKESPQAKLASALKDIRLETIKTRDQLQAAVDAINAFTKQKAGDLQPLYDTYVDEVKKTHDAAESTRARSTNMKESSADYFGTWQTEVGSINNTSLRKKAQKRLDAVRKNYDGVINSLVEATKAFKPFLSDLDDVQKTLANDVTAGGVKAVQGTVNNANANQRIVLKSINDAIRQLAEMEKQLSTQRAA